MDYDQNSNAGGEVGEKGGSFSLWSSIFGSGDPLALRPCGWIAKKGLRSYGKEAQRSNAENCFRKLKSEKKLIDGRLYGIPQHRERSDAKKKKVRNWWQ